MPKKYNKLHRHKDKQSTRTRTHRKHKKEHALSQNPLEPIQEVSKEKVRVDKNACGDYLDIKPHIKDEKSHKSRRPKDKDDNLDQVNKKNDLKDTKKLENQLNEKLVRHHSLEKPENSLLTKTKWLFRKEKSFNDAVESCDTNDKIYKNKDTKKEKIHKHHSRKREENHGDNYNVLKAESRDTNDNFYGNKESKKEKIHKHRSKKREENYGENYNETRVESCETNDNIYGNKDTTKEKIHKHHSKKREENIGDIYNEARVESCYTNDNIFGNKDTAKEKIHKHHSKKREENYGDIYNEATAESCDTNDNIYGNKDTKKEKIHKHYTRKTEENYGDSYEMTRAEIAEKIPEENCFPNADNNPPEILKTKHNKPLKPKHKSKDKSPQIDTPLYGRVQEVIYCQMNQVPYKMKNDKNSMEVKDLYRRLRRQRRPDKEKKERTKSRSREDDQKKYQLLDQTKIFERCVDDNKKRHNDHNRKGKHHRKDEFPPQINYSDVQETIKHKSIDSSEITLGPYKKYFEFEKKHHSEHCKKHNKEERAAKYTKRERSNAREHIKSSPDEKHKNRRSQEKSDTKKETDEEKIHQIIEGDLKNYFFKIQTMIDNKLDAILQGNKHEKRRKREDLEEKRESRKRNRSKSKEKPCEICMESKKENEEKEKMKKKLKSSERKKEENLTKEEIINEVLKRLKQEENEKIEFEEKLKKYRGKHDDRPTKSQELTDKIYTKIKSMILKSPDGRNTSEDVCVSQNKKDLDISSSEKSSQRKHLHGSITINQISTSQSLQVLEYVRPQESSKSHRHKECKEYREENRHSKRTGKNKLAEYEPQTGPFHEKIQIAKDSLEHIRHRSSSPRELIIPVEDMFSEIEKNKGEFKKQHKGPHTYSLSRKQDTTMHVPISELYTVSSSCRNFSEQHVNNDIVSRKGKDDAISFRRNRLIYSASEETVQGRYHEEKRRSSSPGKYTERVDIANQPKSRNEEIKQDKRRSPSRNFSKKELEINGTITNSKDAEFIQSPCHAYIHRSPPRHHFTHSSTQGPEPFLEQIFSPPDNFKMSSDLIDNKQTLDGCSHGFIIQGVEPPILECARSTSRKNRPVRKLECKTVSVLGIPPQIQIKELPIVSQTQTSNKSNRSSVTERDLVETRKKSKRFKLYYKYSTIDNAQDDIDGLSDARSIVSDSHLVVSDPSEEETIAGEIDKVNNIEISQVVHRNPKNWNRISTPRDSHLNNIIEEPSNVSTCMINQQYFVPLRGTKEYYRQGLLSSDSETCFRIKKKPANSNKSFQSKDICVGKHIPNEHRYEPFDVKSRSDFKVASKVNGLYVFKSRSDVFLDNNRSNTIKSIFIEDTHPFVRSRNNKQDSRRKSAFENVLKEKDFLITSCKGCQTTEDQTNEVVNAMVEDTKKIMVNKQKQFQEIYKTIDNLEENIQSSRHRPPETVETAVSSMFLTMSYVPKIVENIENIAIQTCKDNLTGKIDAAIGSPMGSRQSERPKRKLSVKQIRDMAVGDSEVKLPLKVKTPRSKSEKPQRKVSKQRTTSVSPIRLMEDTFIQVAVESKTKPKTPRTKPFVSRLSESKRPKYTREGSCQWSSSSKGTEAKKDDYGGRIPKETHPKSPIRSRLNSKGQTQRNTNNIPQKSAQCVKVFRSEEKSSNLKKRNNLMNECSSEAAKEFIAPHSEQSSRKGADKPTYIASSRPVIIINPKESRVGGATKNSAREHKSRAKTIPKINQVVEHTSCLHHSLPKKSQTPAFGQSAGAHTNIKPLIMNAATYKCQPYVQTKSKGLNSSTSSSISEAMSQAIRRSKSLVDFKSNKGGITRSKSEICYSPETNKYGHIIKDESMVRNYMEKFTNRPKLRTADSRSHVTSLDRYIGNKFSSRLFLTKDYKGASISAYQKRKLYDQSIRQKMKKKFRYSKMDVGPQIFEVRFLSMVNQEYNRQNETSDYRLIASYDNPSCKVDRNGYPSELNNNSDILSESERKLIMETANNLKVKERNLVFDKFNDIPRDVHIDSNNSKNLNKVIIKTCNIVENPEIYPEKLVQFFKKFLDTNNFNEKLIKDTSCTCSKFSKNCTSCNNFISLINDFYSFLSKYRDSYETTDPAECNIVKLEVFNTSQGNDLKRTEEPINKNHEFQLSLPQMKSSQPKIENIFSGSYKQISSDSYHSTGSSGPNFNNAVECLSVETVAETDSLILCQPMSCPVFATNSSSFEFLYEETSSTENGVTPRDVIFANLTRPFDQTINFSTSQYNAEAPFFRRHNFESPTGSIESGYASIKSVGRCTNSLSNFFKKPNIAALLKPILMKKKSELSATEEPSEQAHLDRDNIYKQMTDNCQLYARKIRQSSETKLEENVDEYQEFSLEFLLGRNGSDVLKSKEMRPIERNIEVSNEKMEQEVDENKCDFACMEEQWVEISSSAACQEDNLKNCKESENGFKLVLSNECLRIDSITYLEPDVLVDESKYIGIKNSLSNNFCNQNDESSITLDFSLDSNNPFIPNNDSTTKKFFTSLIKIYEKEMEICNRLYADDLFEKELLSAVKERKHKKSKKGRFCRFFKKKLPEPYETKTIANFQQEASSRLQTNAANARKYFTMLAEAVKINENIDNEIKICGLLKLLERIEKGEFQIFENDDHVNLEEEIRSQVTETFVSIYGLCKVEAKKLKRRLMENEFKLIKSYAIKHRIGLLSKTDIVISYIGRGIIQTEDQLKAAVTFLIHSQTQEVNIKEFEEYCKFPK